MLTFTRRALKRLTTAFTNEVKQSTFTVLRPFWTTHNINNYTMSVGHAV